MPDFFLVKDIHDLITHAKFGDDRLRGLGVVASQISAFPIDFAGRPYNTLTLPCERVMWSVCHNSESYKSGWTRVGPRNHVLGGGPDPSMGRGNFGGCSHLWNALDCVSSQRLQQHRIADLSAVAAHHGKCRLQNGLTHHRVTGAGVWLGHFESTVCLF